ncbi:MAG: hypothetical protein J7501_00255 [Bdellovibrio sp.]|nr:hypothetical protein [Bdellovibrio sp.]
MNTLPVSNPVYSDAYKKALVKFFMLLGEGHALKGDYAGFAFSKLPEHFQMPVLSALQEWVQFFEMHSQGAAKVSDKQLLWRFLSVFRLTPESDMFGKLDDDTCLESYNRAGLQTFRSLSFMDVCSYSLDEVVSVPWPQLYTRDEKITQRYMELQASIADGTLQHTDLQGIIPVHEVIEISGFDRLSTTIKPMYLSPLYDITGQVVGAIHAFKILECKSLKAPINLFAKREMSTPL